MSDLQLFAYGRLSELTPLDRSALMHREPPKDEGVAGIVAGLIADVRSRGDVALAEMAERFDSVELAELEVPQSAWTEALGALAEPVRRALDRAAQNIRSFHSAQRPRETRVDIEPGVTVTRMWTPLQRAGVYAPGGTAAYPSSVLMGAVSARAAGVDEVIVCSPPGSSGLPPREVLAACAIAKADRLFALGGAGAVAALAYGTKSVPAVDVIVGPGNRWVTEAKRQVARDVAIDAPAGPSEVLVIADDTADAHLVAMEMMAQAEHDPDAVSVLVTPNEPLADAVRTSLARLLETAPRAAIARSALEKSGAVLIADSMDDALGFSEEFAPEHLSLMTADASDQAVSMRNAGTIFVGHAASVAFGDYMTGANHVLPTGGRARSYSGLSTQHFLRSFTVQEIDASGARSMADDVASLAAAEGLPAHAQAAAARRGS